MSLAAVENAKLGLANRRLEARSILEKALAEGGAAGGLGNLDVGSVRTEALEAAITTAEALDVTTRDVVALLHSARVVLTLRQALRANDWVTVGAITAHSAASSRHGSASNASRDLVAAARLECRRVRAEHILQERLVELAEAVQSASATGHYWAINTDAVDTARLDRAIDVLLGTGCERIAVQRLLRIALVLRKMRAASTEGAVEAIFELHVRMVADIEAERAAQELARINAEAERAAQLAADALAHANPAFSSVTDGLAPVAPPGIASAPPGVVLDAAARTTAAVVAAVAGDGEEDEGAEEPTSTADAWQCWTLPTGEEGSVLGVDIQAAMSIGSAEVTLLGRHAQYWTTLKRLLFAMERAEEEPGAASRPGAVAANDELAVALQALSDAGCPTAQSRATRDAAAQLLLARRALARTPLAPPPGAAGTDDWAAMESALADSDLYDAALASTLPAKALLELRTVQATVASWSAWCALVGAMSRGAARRSTSGPRAYRLECSTSDTAELDGAIARAEASEVMLRAAGAKGGGEHAAVTLLPLARTLRFVRHQLRQKAWPLIQSVLLKLVGYGDGDARLHASALLDSIDPTIAVREQSEGSSLAAAALLRAPLDAAQLPLCLPAATVDEFERVRCELVLQRTMEGLRQSLAVGAIDPQAPGGVDAAKISVAAIDAAVDATRLLSVAIGIDPVEITELRALLLVVVAVRRLRAAVMDRDWYKVSEVLRSIREVAPLDRLQHPEVRTARTGCAAMSVGSCAARGCAPSHAPTASHALPSPSLSHSLAPSLCPFSTARPD